MKVLAQSDSLANELANSESWDWSSPIGLGVFIVAISLTLALLAWTIRTLSAIEREESKRK